MNPDEYEDIIQHQTVATQAAQATNLANANQQYYVQEQEKNLAEAQLECETTLNKLNHQLKQDVQEAVEGTDDTIFKWNSIEDVKKRRLTDDGVNRIMELMSFYVNKENLLSNFSEEQINKIMLTFRLAFSGNILMRYKIYFRQPTFEECKVIFLQRIEEFKKLKVFAREMLGKETSEEKEKEISEKILEGYEARIEYEINKIREEKKKEMLSEFELLFEQLSQLVYASLNRAWKGEERGSLRRHMNVSEVLGPVNQMQKRGGMFRWMKD